MQAVMDDAEDDNGLPILIIANMRKGPIREDDRLLLSGNRIEVIESKR